jgi:hypothetical protein
MRYKEYNWFLKLILPSRVRAISLAPFGIYFRPNEFRRFKLGYNKILKNHEDIHWEQQLELMYVPFYILYILEWIIKFPTSENAYLDLSFEREAYANQEDFQYLENRTPYSWAKYIWKNKQKQ